MLSREAPDGPSTTEGLPRHVQDLIGRRLNEILPSMEEVDPGTRLGQVLLRLRAALRDAQAERQVSQAFSDGLIAAVPRLRRFAMVRAGSAAEADDMVQGTLLKAWEHRARFQPGTNLIAWLFTILRNAHINQGLRSRREVEDVDGTHASRLSLPPRAGASHRPRRVAGGPERSPDRAAGNPPARGAGGRRLRGGGHDPRVPPRYGEEPGQPGPRAPLPRPGRVTSPPRSGRW